MKFNSVVSKWEKVQNDWMGGGGGVMGHGCDARGGGAGGA